MVMFFKTLQQPIQQVAPLPRVTILVFKTNIHSIRAIKMVEEKMNQLEGLIRWNVDRDDVDNVLRIETIFPDPGHVIDLVNRAGFLCEELPD